MTEIGNSPIQANSQNGGQRQATTFKVVITLDEEVPDVRPGFTCTAEITTATQPERDVGADPGADRARIAVRSAGQDRARGIANDERRRSERGHDDVRRTSRRPGTRGRRRKAYSWCATSKAVFTPVKIGIAGEKYFEVLDGLKAGDQVITGPFANVRELADGQEVRLQEAAARTGAGSIAHARAVDAK